MQWPAPDGDPAYHSIQCGSPYTGSPLLSHTLVVSGGSPNRLCMGEKGTGVMRARTPQPALPHGDPFRRGRLDGAALGANALVLRQPGAEVRRMVGVAQIRGGAGAGV